MMQQLRNPRIMKGAMLALLLLTIPAFVLFYGFGEGAGGGGGQAPDVVFVTVHTENGEVELNRDRLNAAKDRLAQDLASVAAQAYGPQVYTPQLVSQVRAGLTNRDVADYAVGQVALSDLAERLGVTVSSGQVARQLRDQGVTSAQLEQFLASQRKSEAQFLREYMADLRDQRARQIVTSAARVSLLEIFQEYLLANEMLTGSVVRIPAGDYTEGVTVEDAELAEFYEENKADFTVGEQRIYRYVKASVPPADRNVVLDDADLRFAYEELTENAAPEFFEEEGIVVRHIQIAKSEGATTSSLATAEELAEGIRAGADMAELANEFSDDLQNLSYQESGLPQQRGGLLDDRLTSETETTLVERYGQEWLEVVKALAESQANGDQRVAAFEAGNFAYVVRVESVSEGGKKPFEAVRSQLETRERMRIIRERDAARIEQVNALEQKVRDVAARMTSLERIAAEVDASTGVSSPSLTTSNFIPGLGSFFNAGPVLQELEEGQISPVLRSGSQDVVLLQVAEVIPPAPRPFDEVRDQVRALVSMQKAVELAREKANALLAEVEAGDQLSSAALELSLPPAQVLDTPFSRQAAPAPLAQSGLFLAKSFGMKSGETILLEEAATAADVPTAFLLFQAHTVNPPDKKKFLEDMAALESRQRLNKGNAFLEEFRRDAVTMLNVDYNEEVMGEE